MYGIVFNQYRSQLEALFYTYCSNGGAQIMITVVNRQDQKRMENKNHWVTIFN